MRFRKLVFIIFLDSDSSSTFFLTDSPTCQLNYNSVYRIGRVPIYNCTNSIQQVTRSTLMTKSTTELPIEILQSSEINESRNLTFSSEFLGPQQKTEILTSTAVSVSSNIGNNSKIIIIQYYTLYYCIVLQASKTRRQ